MPKLLRSQINGVTSSRSGSSHRWRLNSSSPMMRLLTANATAVLLTNTATSNAQDHHAAGLHATANNALGAALVEGGRPAQAVSYLQAALKARADYFDAHYNLGFALAQQNDFAAAVDQFQTALRLQPQDAAVEANLGAALAEMGRYADARAHFQHALLLDPTQPIAKENLEALKEMNPR